MRKCKVVPKLLEDQLWFILMNTLLPKVEDNLQMVIHANVRRGTEHLNLHRLRYNFVRYYDET